MLGHGIELAVAAAHQTPQIAVGDLQTRTVNTVAAKQIGQRMRNRWFFRHGVGLDFFRCNSAPVVRLLGRTEQAYGQLLANSLYVIPLDEHPPVEAVHNPFLIIRTCQVTDRDHDPIIAYRVIPPGLSQLNGRILDQRMACLVVPQFTAGQRQRRRNSCGKRKCPVGRLDEKVVHFLHSSLQQLCTGRFTQVIRKIKPNNQHILVALRRNRIPRGNVCLIPPTGADTRLSTEQLVTELTGIFGMRQDIGAAADRSEHTATGQAGSFTRHRINAFRRLAGCYCSGPGSLTHQSNRRLIKCSVTIQRNAIERQAAA